MGVNIKNLVRLCEAEGGGAVKEAFAAGHVKPADIDLGKLWSEIYGYGSFLECRNGALATHKLLETGQGAVTTQAFQTISGQIVYNATMEAYTSEEFVFSKLIPGVQTNLSGELIPGVSEIGDEAMVVPETEPFPLVGVREDWIRTPETKKRGMICPITREAIFFDKTGILLERCKKVGYWLGVNVEKRAIDCVIDENTTDHRYNWRNVSIASYGDNSGTHTWDNLVASNAFVDWTDIDNVEQAFNAIVDPNTGEPILWEPRHIITTMQLQRSVARTLSATEIRVSTPGFATTGNPTQTQAANPYLNKFTHVSSRLLAARLATDTDWFVGDVSKYAKRMINWEIIAKEAPPNSHDEFHRDIVQQFRSDVRDAFAVVEPRAIVKSTA